MPSSSPLLCSSHWLGGRVGRDLAATALGVLPFLLWECFALFYYGSLVPNTAYAKLNTGIPRVDLVGQGFWYFADSLRWDPGTLLLARWRSSWRPVARTDDQGVSQLASPSTCRMSRGSAATS